MFLGREKKRLGILCPKVRAAQKCSMLNSQHVCLGCAQSPLQQAPMGSCEVLVDRVQTARAMDRTAKNVMPEAVSYYNVSVSSSSVL